MCQLSPDHRVVLWRRGEAPSLSRSDLRDESTDTINPGIAILNGMVEWLVEIRFRSNRRHGCIGNRRGSLRAGRLLLPEDSANRSVIPSSALNGTILNQRVTNEPIIIVRDLVVWKRAPEALLKSSVADCISCGRHQFKHFRCIPASLLDPQLFSSDSDRLRL